MRIRHTQFEDLERVMEIYAAGIAFMRSHGNATQWVNGYPSEELIREDIEKGISFVCEDEGEIVAVFALIQGKDPTYAYIEGQWLDDKPYGVVHRIASVKPQAGTFCLNWAYEQCGNLRIDTHAANIPMQNLVAKLGFIYCGIIYVADGTPRRAYQKPAADE